MRIFKMIKKMYIVPFYSIYSIIFPIRYAKKIGVNVGENVKIYGGNRHMFSTEPWLVTIGNNVHITKDVLFLTHDGGTLILDKKDIDNFVLTGKIIIGENTYIGTRTIILPGVKIGSNCIIGAGSVVSKDIPDNSVAAGVPAKVINDVEGYKEKIMNVIKGDNSRYISTLEEVWKIKNKNL